MRPLILLLSLLTLTACITGPPPTASPERTERDPTWTITPTAITPTITPTAITPTITPTAITPTITPTAITPVSTPTRIVPSTSSGQALPRPTTPAVLCVEVVAGDTLADIAHTYDVQPGILVDWNKRKFPSLITNPDLLTIGWVLCMPVGFDTNTPSPKTTP